MIVQKLELNNIDTKSKKKIEEFQRYFISIAKQLGDKNSKKYEKGFHQCVCE